MLLLCAGDEFEVLDLDESDPFSSPLVDYSSSNPLDDKKG